jgi:hypothetical protein
MAKTVQATGTNQDITSMETEATTAYETMLKVFGNKVAIAAAKAAKAAIKAVQTGDQAIESLNTQIDIKKTGNSHKLHSLAIECVKLTMNDQNQADLKAAASLMKASCEYVERITVIDYQKANPQAERTSIRKLVPSWGVYKSKILNAMEQAGIDPNSHAQPTGMIAAYDEYKRTHPETTTTGRTPRPAQTAQVTAAVKKQAETLVKLSDSARSALDNIAVALQQLSPAQQKAAVELLTATLGSIRNLAAAEDSDKDAEKDGVQTRRRARPNPVQVPDSNQVAS